MIFINKYKLYILGGSLGLFLGVCLYFVQPLRWKGQALVRIGQFSQAQTQTDSSNYSSSSIEPLSTAVERLKSTSFIKAVAQRAKNEELTKLLNVDEGGGMVIRPTRNGDSLEITVSAGSEEMARAAIDAIASELVSKHQAILNLYQADAQKELAQLETQIEVLSKRIETFTDKGSSGDKAVAGLVILATQPVLEHKVNLALGLRKSLSGANTRPTSLVEATAVSEKRAFTSLWRACLFGALSGILLSAIWIRLK